MIETKQQVFDDLLRHSLGLTHTMLDQVGNVDLCEDMEASDQTYWHDRYTNAAINSEPTTLTTNQMVFYRYLLEAYQDHNQDIMMTLSWCERHMNSMPYGVHLAYRSLSSVERNQVINELALPF